MGANDAEQWPWMGGREGMQGETGEKREVERLKVLGEGKSLRLVNSN